MIQSAVLTVQLKDDMRLLDLNAEELGEVLQMMKETYTKAAEGKGFYVVGEIDIKDMSGTLDDVSTVYASAETIPAYGTQRSRMVN